MEKTLAEATTEEDKNELLQQIEAFEKNLAEKMRVEGEEQNLKLKQALEERRTRRKNLREKVAKEKHERIKDTFNNNATGKVNSDSNDD